MVNDIQDSLKYMFLSYVEYLEYIVRLALVKYEGRQDGQEYKASWFIKILFEHEGIDDPIKAKIKSPEVDISF